MIEKLYDQVDISSHSGVTRCYLTPNYLIFVAKCNWLGWWEWNPEERLRLYAGNGDFITTYGHESTTECAFLSKVGLVPTQISEL